MENVLAVLCTYDVDLFFKDIIVVFAFKNNAKLKWTIRVSKNKSLWVFSNVIAHF
jgi:hypothetical protein